MAVFYRDCGAFKNYSSLVYFVRKKEWQLAVKKSHCFLFSMRENIKKYNRYNLYGTPKYFNL
jgi:hypothetical protein|tara:strand:- start:603 stop:788 length:186 start_codon:yes stop_codon:yes gene_type:complete